MADKHPVKIREAEVLGPLPMPAPELLPADYPALAAAAAAVSRGEPFWGRVLAQARTDTSTWTRKYWVGATGVPFSILLLAYLSAWHFRGFDTIKENLVWLGFVIGSLGAASVVYFVARLLTIPPEMERQLVHDAATLANALRGEIHVRDERIVDLTVRERDRPRLMVIPKNFTPTIRHPSPTPPPQWRQGLAWERAAVAYLAITNDPAHPTKEDAPLISATLTFTVEGNPPLTIDGGWVKVDLPLHASLPPLGDGGIRIPIGQMRALAIALRFPNAEGHRDSVPPCWALNASSCHHENWLKIAPGWVLVGPAILVEIRLHGVEINERRCFHLNSDTMLLIEIDCDVTANAISSETR